MAALVVGAGSCNAPPRLFPGGAAPTGWELPLHVQLAVAARLLESAFEADTANGSLSRQQLTDFLAARVWPALGISVGLAAPLHAWTTFAQVHPLTAPSGVLRGNTPAVCLC